MELEVQQGEEKRRLWISEAFPTALLVPFPDRGAGALRWGWSA